MSENDPQRILVLGVGNALLRDEGVGIRVVHELLARYHFPENVRVVDGGVLGLSLTGVLMEADRVILVDAVRGGGQPGDVYRFPWQAKPEHIHYKDSLHQIDMMETLALLPLVGEPPEVVVVGVEFEDIFDYGLELTPRVEGAVEKLIEVVLDELRQLGAEPTPKAEPDKVLDVFSCSG